MKSSEVAKQTLSVAIIVRDDSQPLAETLKSVAGLADEIVVLDTGSSDDSRTTAERAGAKVFEATWANDFSAARNQCWQHATGDWVLWLDAGETLSPDDAQALRRFVDSEASLTKAYMMLVVNPPGMGGEAAEQVGRIRLVPRLPGIEFTGRVRESLSASLEALGIEVEGHPVRIARGQREHAAAVKRRRARRDLVLAEQEIKEVGAEPRLLLTLGESLRNLDQREKALQMFTHAVHRAVAGSSEMLEGYYGVLTTMADGSQESLARQIGTCLEALEIFPLDAQLLCAMGGFLVQQGSTELGIRSFETALDHAQVNPTLLHLVEIHAVAAVCAATAWATLQEHAKAVAILERTLREYPHNPLLQARLAELRSVPGVPSAIVQTMGPVHWQVSRASESAH